MTGDRCGFNTITTGSESQHLHAIIGVFAQSMQDSFTGSDNLGILASLICLFLNEEMSNTSVSTKNDRMRQLTEPDLTGSVDDFVTLDDSIDCC